MRGSNRRPEGASEPATNGEEADAGEREDSRVGYGRPPVATVNARQTSSGTRSIRSTAMLCLVVGRIIPNWSLSWVAARPPIAAFTSPVNASSGMDPPNDSASPLTRLVAPGAISEELGSPLYHGGVVDESSAGLHPAKYFAGIARLASRRSCASSRALGKGNAAAGSRTPVVLCIPPGWPGTHSTVNPAR